MDTKVIPKRIGFVWKVRKSLRSEFFNFLHHLAGTDDSRELFVNLLREQSACPKPCELSHLHSIDRPYADLAWSGKPDRTRFRSDIVFVTGRFRSGSTLLWNLFRNVPGV